MWGCCHADQAIGSHRLPSIATTTPQVIVASIVTTTAFVVTFVATIATLVRSGSALSTDITTNTATIAVDAVIQLEAMTKPFVELRVSNEELTFVAFVPEVEAITAIKPTPDPTSVY